MLPRLPEIIDPLAFAERRIELKGVVAIQALSRLEDLLTDTSGDVAVELFFGKQGRQAFIEGMAKTTLQMRCQNCLETVAVPLVLNIKLGLISTLAQADQLPEGYEPLLLDEETLVLKEIIEDELLLAVPTFPKHIPTCINIGQKNTAPLAQHNQVTLKPHNPFAVLAKLKSTGE